MEDIMTISVEYPTFKHTDNVWSKFKIKDEAKKHKTWNKIKSIFILKF